MIASTYMLCGNLRPHTIRETYLIKKIFFIRPRLLFADALISSCDKFRNSTWKHALRFYLEASGQLH